MNIKDAINILSINKIKANSYEKVDFIFFLISIFILPISIKWSSKLLFISLALGLIISIYKKDFSWFKKHRFTIIIFLVFIVYIVTQGILIDGLEVFFKKFDKAAASYLAFLLVPIFFTKEKWFKIIPKVLISGLFFLFFLITILSIIEMEIYDREKVLEVFDIHHLYASLYILFATNFFLSRLVKARHNRKTNLLCLLILVVFLLVFKSKAAIAVFVLLILYHIILSVKLNWLKLTAIIVIAFSLIYFFDQHLSSIYLKALNFRIKIWDAAITSILDNPIFGYGSLNEYSTLNYQHFINADFAYLDSNFNAHNQYLSLLLKFGLIGLILFFIPFAVLTKTIKKELRKEYIGFLILFVTMAYVESLINRHHGIVFTAIMLYYYNAYKQNEKL